MNDETSNELILFVCLLLLFFEHTHILLLHLFLCVELNIKLFFHFEGILALSLDLLNLLRDFFFVFLGIKQYLLIFDEQLFMRDDFVLHFQCLLLQLMILILKTCHIKIKILNPLVEFTNTTSKGIDFLLIELIIRLKVSLNPTYNNIILFDLRLVLFNNILFLLHLGIEVNHEIVIAMVFNLLVIN